jgi:hypothetical protein
LSQERPDIKGEVEKSRGFLKKLQLVIPGLRGYRQLEDIRVSDELLRNQLADFLDQARANLYILRQKLAMNNDLMNLSQVGSLIAQLQSLSGEIRHAQQGYSGFAAPISINEEKLESLYEYDYSFANMVINIRDSTSQDRLKYDPSSPGDLNLSLTQILKQVQDVRSMWIQRIERMEKILIEGK